MNYCEDNREVCLEYEKYALGNGLQVVLQRDVSDPVVAVAIHYHVGSAREKEGKTGFAHFFEHMLFQRSENIPRNAFFHKINELGGEFNGGTGSDGTVYYEKVPRDALEKVLWMESDRMGYFINTVTQHGLEREIDVVSNEKRQNYDTRPYGQLIPIFSRYAFPKGHPYSWTTIGELDDLRAATVRDVRDFYAAYYRPNNATLVISGDFEYEEARALIDKYFAEIPGGDELPALEPLPAPLAAEVRVFHEDAYASMPLLALAFPSVPKYHPDSYALQMLAQLFADGKTSPLYKVVVDSKKLSPEISMWPYERELAGNMMLIIPAFGGVDLNDLYAAVGDAFERFEAEGVDEGLLEGYKAMTEVQLYGSMNGVMQRALHMAQENVFTGNPLQSFTDMDLLRAVTAKDVMDAYVKYIKDKPSVTISFVPKGSAALAVDGSQTAKVTVEDISGQSMKSGEGAVADDDYERTPSATDRSAEPPLLGNTPQHNIPLIWKERGDGLNVWGITRRETPLVRFSIALRGGMLHERPEKAGVASLYSQILLAGTQNRTPEELEYEFKRLGADVQCSAYTEYLDISGICLKRNLNAVVNLLAEVLSQPRFDQNEFGNAKQSTLANIAVQADDPGSVAAVVMRKLLYGEGILSNIVAGTAESVAGITIDDIKRYHATCVSPMAADVHFAGDVDGNHVRRTTATLREIWKGGPVEAPVIAQGDRNRAAGKLYFVDFPGAQQSSIMVSCHAMARRSDDFYPAYIANYRFGDGSQGLLFNELRLKRGYTYGAYSYFGCGNYLNRFVLSTKVQGIKTGESLEVIKELLEGYADGFTGEDMEFTRSSIRKSGFGAYETPEALVGMISEISQFGLPEDYVKRRETLLDTITAEEVREAARKYMDPARMTYLVVGDAATQLQRVREIGLGEPVMLDKTGGTIG